MGTALKIRENLSAADLRRLARKETNRETLRSLTAFPRIQKVSL